MTRLLTLVALGLAIVFAPTLSEAKSKRIHVTAETVQQTFTGDDMAKPKLGDQLISSVKLRDKHDDEVGAGAGVCTIVRVPPLETQLQCLLTVEFAKGQIIFGGVAPLPVPEIVANFAILGGTDAFRKARGEATLTVISPILQEAVFELE
jgi:hypothetical protein